MLRRTLALAFILQAWACTVHAQTATLSGTVRDAASLAPLHQATVQVFLTDTSYGTTTDAQGHFRFLALPIGLHRVRASYLGYQSTEIPEVWVRLGKEEHLEMLLTVQPVQLAAAEVVTTVRRIAAISSHTLTVEQSLRYPATFYDPTRVALTQAGSASINDQSNHFSVRANSPSCNAWLLEGAEIVTPNHLTNGGTSSDQPTLTGGTTILSAQMLGTSRLLMGGMNAAYGNALGGILDLNLRPGMNQRRGYTAQASLLGLDFSTEGPFRTGGQASYLINYRYSTVGLLGAMGVDLGDEAITFQDLSFNIAVPLGARGYLGIFGMGGNSSNRFAAKDSADQEFDKDSRNIDYEASMGAAGITFRKPIGARTIWRTTVIYSANLQQRHEEGQAFHQDFSYYIDERASLDEQKLSAVSNIAGRIGTRTDFNVGASAMQRIVSKNIILVEEVDAVLLRPYLHTATSLSSHWRLDLGAAWSHYSPNGSNEIEPRATLRWTANRGTSVAVSAGQRAQLPLVQSFTVSALAPYADNSGIGLMRMQEVVLAVDHPINEFLTVHAEAYMQQRDQVPVALSSGSTTASAGSLSLVNAWDQQFFALLYAIGTARTTGAEISLSRSMARGFYYMVNTTVLNSDYTDAGARAHPSRWNTTYMGNALFGCERGKQLHEGSRTWGFNLRIGAQGGLRYTPFTLVNGAFQPYAAQNAAAYRVDVRIYRKRERKQRTGMWSLDLLNATNAQNEAFRYYDERKGEVVVKYQLGIIPNIGYRIEF
ncbi:MAG: carboxypeptidase regulatory-like domain-containing protein [Flavobacteriales bacterium]|nr:carboxypeptidase regulatory-like domain-containing protein [Flavobacteriales bacterium]